MYSNLPKEKFLGNNQEFFCKFYYYPNLSTFILLDIF